MQNYGQQANLATNCPPSNAKARVNPPKGSNASSSALPRLENSSLASIPSMKMASKASIKAPVAPDTTNLLPESRIEGGQGEQSCNLSRFCILNYEGRIPRTNSLFGEYTSKGFASFTSHSYNRIPPFPAETGRMQNILFKLITPDSPHF